MLAWALLPASLALLVNARLHHSLVPEDPFAFPKYRVTFLHGLPLLNETAQRWFQHGLRGGELEFLDQPWQESSSHVPPIQSIDGGDSQPATTSNPSASSLSTFRLEHMMLGPKTSFACLIPPPPTEEPASPLADDASADVTPGHTWSLLQPLAGTCLYHRQGWFTYAYCHNSHVRQFHELSNPQAQRLGEYRPEEDTEWEAYTLGRAPPTLDPGADLTVAEEAALAANVELARGPGSRYLVQRWGDGTFCDKTNRKREIEIQFHCSMTMTDTVLFVKETQTCHYVMHIATPRLCGEPGFKSRLDSREESYIRCREILNQDAYVSADRTLPPADHPYRIPRQRTKQPVIAPAPQQAPPSADGDAAKQGEVPKAIKQHDLIRRALEKLLGGGSANEVKAGEVFVEPLGDGENEVIIEFVEAELEDDGTTRGEEGEGKGEATSGEEGKYGSGKGRAKAKTATSIEDVLRAAGYKVKGEKEKKEKKDGKHSGKDDSKTGSGSGSSSQGRKGEQKRGGRGGEL